VFFKSFIKFILNYRKLTQFLDAELQKYNSWEDMERTNNNSISRLFEKHNFYKCKKQGTGTPTIHKFLGADLWKRTRIQHAWHFCWLFWLNILTQP